MMFPVKSAVHKKGLKSHSWVSVEKKVGLSRAKVNKKKFRMLQAVASKTACDKMIYYYFLFLDLSGSNIDILSVLVQSKVAAVVAVVFVIKVPRDLSW